MIGDPDSAAVGIAGEVSKAVSTRAQLVWHRLTSLLAERADAQGLVEYALILVLISVASIAVMQVLGTTVSGVFSQINAAF